MVFIHDTRDKSGKHDNVDEYLITQGHKVVRSKMYVGDITLLNNQSICIDLKQNLIEVCGNVCQQHERFRRELERAQDCGIHLIILVEHGGGIRCLEDVRRWQNPRLRLRPDALTGERLYRILKTMEEKYGVEFLFCDKRQTGKRIIELLGATE